MLRANAAHGITMVSRPDGWSIDKLLRQWRVVDRVGEATQQASYFCEITRRIKIKNFCSSSLCDRLKCLFQKRQLKMFILGVNDP